MFGLIGHITVQPGRRAELAAILLEGSDALPGCMSYVVAEDVADADGLWVTEVWTDQAAHRASLELPEVQASIARGRPLIVEFDQFHETRPLQVGSA
ncbi:antibiotic biosynthesis monooxygenase [Nocardioides silvaticus]|uniref:Antibiotic biosynthesis monooxygenase n=1 Tax=Nocardioides silvaticus TaxID=2201891 RepID=A0A316TKP0_9ACTN|nr:putative quinol monooxygenase [Nocardioides silvaticus]PWN02862.1 antibiotic biosynthesis monooxygenase [Nocardioides silvaticus]